MLKNKMSGEKWLTTNIDFKTLPKTVEEIVGMDQEFYNYNKYGTATHDFS